MDNLDEQVDGDAVEAVDAVDVEPTTPTPTPTPAPLIDLARADADHVRDSARADAEKIRAEAAADALRVRGDARDAAHRLDVEARADAARLVSDAAAEAGRLREDAERALNDANARARQILAQAEENLRQVREEAALTATRIREEAESERTRVLHEARTLAETETNRLFTDAHTEATRIREAALAEARQTREQAEVDAQTLRESGELDRVRIVEEARAQAYFETRHIREEGVKQARSAMLRVPATAAPIHSSEISLREFPRSLRGFDPDAVSKWLALVEQSYSLVEDELERRRHDLDDMITVLGQMRRHLGRAPGAADAERMEEEMGRARASWNKALEIAASTVPSTRLGFDTLVVRTALMESPLRRAINGYSRDQVRRLLETSAAQLARLENQLHLAHAENERLRARFLDQIAEFGTGDRSALSRDDNIRSLHPPDDD